MASAAARPARRPPPAAAPVVRRGGRKSSRLREERREAQKLSGATVIRCHAIARLYPRDPEATGLATISSPPPGLSVRSWLLLQLWLIGIQS